MSGARPAKPNISLFVGQRLPDDLLVAIVEQHPRAHFATPATLFTSPAMLPEKGIGPPAKAACDRQKTPARVLSIRSTRPR